jgi:hypothetical protein
MAMMRKSKGKDSEREGNSAAERFSRLFPLNPTSELQVKSLPHAGVKGIKWSHM